MILTDFIQEINPCQGGFHPQSALISLISFTSEQFPRETRFLCSLGGPQGCLPSNGKVQKVKDFLPMSVFYLSWPGPEQANTLGDLETESSFPYYLSRQRQFTPSPFFMLQNMYLWGKGKLMHFQEICRNDLELSSIVSVT